MHHVTEEIFSKSSFPVCMAPMVGLSHAIFREIVRSYMPSEGDQNSFSVDENNTTSRKTIWPTEMLNSRRIPDEMLGKNSETYVLKNETFLIPQILGNQKEEIQKSVVRLFNEWNIFGIDINMGCPVQKALKHNYGVSLMGDIDYARSVIEFARQASDQIFDLHGRYLPVSVKLRAVDSDKSADELCRIVDLFSKSGADWITLHPRTASQKRKGTADWDQINILKNRVDIPIIGNGDVQIADDVFQMLSETQANKVMIGRALTARPWIMWQVGYRMGFNNPLSKQIDEKPPLTASEEGQEYGRMLLLFIELCELHLIQKLGLNENLVRRKIIFFVRTGHVWLQFGHDLLSKMTRSQTTAEMKSYIVDFFKSEQLMFQKTQLRQ